MHVDGGADRGAMNVYCIDASRVAETVYSAPGEILASRVVVADTVYSAPCEILARGEHAEPGPCATGNGMAGAYAVHNHLSPAGLRELIWYLTIPHRVSKCRTSHGGSPTSRLGEG